MAPNPHNPWRTMLIAIGLAVSLWFIVYFAVKIVLLVF